MPDIEWKTKWIMSSDNLITIPIRAIGREFNPPVIFLDAPFRGYLKMLYGGPEGVIIVIGFRKNSFKGEL
jgi:hypothetical protein